VKEKNPLVGHLARALLAHDAGTYRHSLRVRRHALQLARALRLGDRLCRRLGRAARFHDLGKLAVPPAVLRKEGPLAPEEWALLRLHPAVGECLLAPVCRDAEALAAVRHHHERWDGRGYPDGLGGKDIPLLARLLTVADVFDALASPRPYRNGGAMRVEDALEFLRQHAGAIFDPALVPAFTALVSPAAEPGPGAQRAAPGRG
jgi:HD-GYP domain-containing protein (c-di-GMP phosphodiesterase class II)